MVCVNRPLLSLHPMSPLCVSFWIRFEDKTGSYNVELSFSCILHEFASIDVTRHEMSISFLPLDRNTTFGFTFTLIKPYRNSERTNEIEQTKENVIRDKEN
jgi:hypothetical protein